MATSIQGTVVWRGDQDYEATRRSMLWNELKPARFPEVIVTAASETDVVAAVELARSKGLQVAVRAGGHSWKLDPLAIGHYVAETDLLGAPAGGQRSFAKPNWERLQALKREVDPDGLFASYLTPDDRLTPVA